jgi:hypothetical protein
MRIAGDPVKKNDDLCRIASRLRQRARDEAEWLLELLREEPGLHQDRPDFTAVLQRALALGISVEELGQRFEVSRVTAWRWAEGSSAPRTFVRQAILSWLVERLPAVLDQPRRVPRRERRSADESVAGRDDGGDDAIDSTAVADRVLATHSVRFLIDRDASLTIEAKVFAHLPRDAETFSLKDGRKFRLVRGDIRDGIFSYQVYGMSPAEALELRDELQAISRGKG